MLQRPAIRISTTPGRALSAAAALLAAMTCHAAGPWGATRNLSPQQHRVELGEQSPIYYPRLAHLHSAESPVHGDPADRLLREFLDLHTAMRYRRAAEVARQLTEIMPRSPLAHYNLACAQGRLFQTQEAVESLRRAVQFGWRDLAHLSMDPDLNALRATAGYRDVVRELREETSLEGDGPDPHPHPLPEGEGPVSAPQSWSDAVGELHRSAPRELERLGETAALVVLVDQGRIVWMESFGSPAGRPTVGPDEPVEVSSCVGVLALATRLQQLRAESRDVLAHQKGGGLTPSVIPASLSPAGGDRSVHGFTDECRRQVLGPLGMNHTRLEWTGTQSADSRTWRRDLVAHSTARDLACLLAHLCKDSANAGRETLAAGTRYGLERFEGPGASTIGLQASHRGPDASAVLRWNPGRRRGIVVISTGEHGLEAAEAIARVGLGPGPGASNAIPR